jgi:hypothetical protein
MLQLTANVLKPLTTWFVAHVYDVIDASGGYKVTIRENAVARMRDHGIVALNWTTIAAELQRNWALPTGQENGESLPRPLPSLWAPRGQLRGRDCREEGVPSMNSVLPLAAAAVLATGALSTHAVELSGATKNVVLVHGGFVDGSGWSRVYQGLRKNGYNVTIVQNPTTSLADDVAVAKLAIAKQSGGRGSGGHSYGGAVISEAGTDPKVKALVYTSQHSERRRMMQHGADRVGGCTKLLGKPI